VAYVTRGPNRGKIVAIVDIIDQNRALVDGPATGVTRQPMPFKILNLTKFRIKFSHSAGSKTVLKAWRLSDVGRKWDETKWAKGLAAKETRRNLTDYERFQVMRAKQKRNGMIRGEMCRLRALFRKKRRAAGKERKAQAAKKGKKPPPAKK